MHAEGFGGRRDKHGPDRADEDGLPVIVVSSPKGSATLHAKPPSNIRESRPAVR